MNSAPCTVRGDRALERWLFWPAVVLTLCGAVAAIWGYLNEPRSFFAAWVAAFWFWLSMPVGALGLLLIWDLTGGRWEPLARVPLSAMAATFPLFILLFLPLIAAGHDLYPWLAAQHGHAPRNRWYLNPGFFYLRAGVYFLVWNGFAAWRLLRPETARGQWLSGIGLVLLAYCITFAGIDWILSTEPDWFSSIFGMVIGSGQFIVAISGALLLTMLAGRASASADVTGRMAALAAILLAVVIFWAYTSFCQWLIVWEENLRREIHWYVERWRGPWGAVIYALAVAHFLVPFAVLVWTPTKRKVALVGAMCVLLLAADMVHVWWLLLPGLPGLSFSWLDALLMAGIGGLWLLVLQAVLRQRGARFGAPSVARESLSHG